MFLCVSVNTNSGDQTQRLQVALASTQLGGLAQGLPNLIRKYECPCII